MGGFLFVGLDTGGTWKPMLGLAALLVGRGHSVTVLGSPSMRETTEAAGCSFIALDPELDEKPGVALEDDDFESWLQKVCGWEVAAALGPATEASSADVLVIDFLQFNALSAAELIDRPVATVVHFGMTTWGEDGWEDAIDLVNSTRLQLRLDSLPVVGGMAVLWSRADVARCLCCQPNGCRLRCPAMSSRSGPSPRLREAALRSLPRGRTTTLGRSYSSA